MTAPPHAWVGVGQSPNALSTDDTRKQKPRNPAEVGPPVPRQAKVLPSDAKTTAPAQSVPPADDPVDRRRITEPCSRPRSR